MVLTVSFVLSPVIGLFCHRRSADMFLSKPGWADLNSANLTPASGRQDHTTSPYAATSFVSSPFDRSQAFRQPALQPRCAPNAAASTASLPASVTIMIRPSGGVGWREFVEMICPTGEAEYFCKGDWTGRITLIRFNKFGFTRKRDPRANARQPQWLGQLQVNSQQLVSDRPYRVERCIHSRQRKKERRLRVSKGSKQRARPRPLEKRCLIDRAKRIVEDVQ